MTIYNGYALPAFLGKGLAFPFQLDATLARPKIASDDDLVIQSMMQIVLTNVGERPFLVRNGVPYGTRVRTIIFDSADAAIGIVKYEVPRALSIWEPRIIVGDTDAQEILLEDGAYAIVATTRFRFRSTNRSDNFVIPFRIQRAK